MKKTRPGCLSNVAAVPACCVVMVTLPPMGYFQSCPFVLPACQAGTCYFCLYPSTEEAQICRISYLIKQQLKGNNTQGDLTAKNTSSQRFVSF